MWNTNIEEAGKNEPVQLLIREPFSMAYDKDFQCYEDGELEYVTTGYMEGSGYWRIFIPSHPAGNIDDMFAAGITCVHTSRDKNGNSIIYQKDKDRKIIIKAWKPLDTAEEERNDAI